jgi:hypothetical protein
MLLTYKEARESFELKNVLGVCGNSEAARSYLNRGVRMLMNRGNFWGTVQMLKVCISEDCVTWPRPVGTVLALNSCHRNIPVWNEWYSFVPIGAGGVRGEGFGWQNGVCSGELAADNVGTTPVFRQIPCGQTRYVRFYLAVRADIGKTVTVFGIDSNGQVIRSKNAQGIWQEGVTLTLAIGTDGFVSTPMQLREITRIIKDKTQGVVRAFYYDATQNALTLAGAYQPNETSPDYRFSKIHHLMQKCCLSKCDQSVKSLRGLVKLDFVPVVDDTDLVLISNLDALALIIQSVRAREDKEHAEADELQGQAVHELNLELRNKFPLDQTPVKINPFGTATPRRHGIGRII